MMYHQSSTRNQRSKVSNAKKALQVVVLLAVACWLIYQAKNSRKKETENVVKAAAENKLGKAAEEISLGRKGDAGSENVVIIDDSAAQESDRVGDHESNLAMDDNVEATKKNDEKLEDGSSDHKEEEEDGEKSSKEEEDGEKSSKEEEDGEKSSKEEEDGEKSSKEEEANVDGKASGNVSVETGADKSSKVEDDVAVETQETDFGNSSGSGDRVREEMPEKQDASL